MVMATQAILDPQVIQALQALLGQMVMLDQTEQGPLMDQQEMQAQMETLARQDQVL
jgi:hypothetical protein